VLTGHGMRLHVDNGALVVRNGFTRYPQALDERRYFPGDRRRPSRIIVVDGSGSLTFDVMTWLAEQKIPLIRIDWRGNVVTALSESYGLNPKRVKWQLDALASGRAVPIAISLIQQKFKNSIATLKTLPQSGARDRAIRKHSQELGVLINDPPRTIDALLGIEGRAAFSYLVHGNHYRCNGRALGVAQFQMTGIRSARARLERTASVRIDTQRIQSTRS
jgi:CRISP-associated protein Cas1